MPAGAKNGRRSRNGHGDGSLNGSCEASGSHGAGAKLSWETLPGAGGSGPREACASRSRLQWSFMKLAA